MVSDTLGTTTDPVYKAMEILPIGPVMIIDTPDMMMMDILAGLEWQNQTGSE